MFIGPGLKTISSVKLSYTAWEFSDWLENIEWTAQRNLMLQHCLRSIRLLLPLVWIGHYKMSFYYHSSIP